MASLLFNSFWGDLGRGNIKFEIDTIKCMLVDETYTPDKDAHTKRSDVTGEITATGYTAGGKTCTTAVAVNNSTNKITYIIQSVNWTGYSGTSDKAVFYRSRGGAASADELIGVADFGGSVTITGAIMVVADSVIEVNNNA